MAMLILFFYNIYSLLNKVKAYLNQKIKIYQSNRSIVLPKFYFIMQIQSSKV